MLYPSINEIKKKADSRYTLVILAAKRARDIVDGKPALVNTKIKRPVSIAAEEINEELIKVDYDAAKKAEEARLKAEAEAEAEASEDTEEEEAEEAEEVVEEAEAEESEEAEEAEAGEEADDADEDEIVAIQEED